MGKLSLEHILKKALVINQFARSVILQLMVAQLIFALLESTTFLALFPQRLAMLAPIWVKMEPLLY